MGGKRWLPKFIITTSESEVQTAMSLLWMNIFKTSSSLYWILNLRGAGWGSKNLHDRLCFTLKWPKDVSRTIFMASKLTSRTHFWCSSSLPENVWTTQNYYFLGIMYESDHYKQSKQNFHDLRLYDHLVFINFQAHFQALHLIFILLMWFN